MERGLTLEGIRHGLWKSRLDMGTTLNEELYLSGFTDRTAREAAIEQELGEMRRVLAKLGIVNLDEYVEEEIQHLDEN